MIRKTLLLFQFLFPESKFLDVTIICLSNTNPFAIDARQSQCWLGSFPRGPLVSQEFWGSSFMCFKFRTMFVNSDTAIHQGHLDHLMDSDAPLVKMDAKGDPRIIPFGRLLRATGLDEPLAMNQCGAG